MEAPRIQYAKTSDGVSIAYWTAGEGEPLVYLPALPLHCELEWELPTFGDHYEWLTSHHRVIRFDRRNTGLSTRGLEEISNETFVRDIESVLSRVGAERFDLLGQGAGGTSAIHYAGTHPGRVKKLVLLNSIDPAAASAFEATSATRALRAVLEYDWGSFLEMTAGLSWGWSENSHAYASVLKQSFTQPDFMRLAAGAAGDVSNLLPNIVAPTLVIQVRGGTLVTSEDAGREIAASIPDARLLTLEATSAAAAQSDPRMRKAVDEFLEATDPADGSRDAGATPPETPSGMTAILFADIVDSTALTEHLGDGAFRGKARNLDGALRAIIRDNGGTPIEGKLLGDGVLATFASASQAIAAALACGKAGDDGGLPLHLGLHAGDVIREEGNVFGGAVNVAARVSGLSAPGEVLVSDIVRGLARTSAGVSFEDRGEQALKGVGEAVRVWAVLEGE